MSGTAKTPLAESANASVMFWMDTVNSVPIISSVSPAVVVVAVVVVVVAPASGVEVSEDPDPPQAARRTASALAAMIARRIGFPFCR